MSQKTIETKIHSSNGNAQIPKPPHPGPEHKILDVFVGTWSAEGLSYAKGQVKDHPYASAVKWISEETYEWLPGGFFLVHRWDARVGDDDFKGIEIIGYDASSQAYYTRFFDNHGYSPSYQAKVRDNTWTFTGKGQRASVEVSDNGNTMMVKWEWKNDGVNWLPLCDRTATKSK